MQADPADFGILRFPMFASFKLDGIRATIHNGVAMSRSMKPLPNLSVLGPGAAGQSLSQGFQVKLDLVTATLRKSMVLPSLSLTWVPEAPVVRVRTLVGLVWRPYWAFL